MTRALVAAVVILLLTIPPASAHTVAGNPPTNYRSDLVGIVPSSPGLTARLRDLGRTITLTDVGAQEVVVIGYQGEPYLRIGPDGVWENRNSPTLYLNQVLPPGVRPTVPSHATAAATPDWHRRSGAHHVSWHDHRSRWAAPAPPVVVNDPHHAHVVETEWTIPLRIGDGAARILGDIVWLPPPSVLPWLIGALVVAAVATIVSAASWWGITAFVALAVVVDLAHGWALGAGSGPGFGKEAGAFLATSSGIGPVAWVLGGLACVYLPRRAEGALIAAGIAGAAIGTLGGAGDLATLGHSQLPTPLPGDVLRALVAASLGVGVGVAAGAALRRTRVRREHAQPSPDMPLPHSG